MTVGNAAFSVADVNLACPTTDHGRQGLGYDVAISQNCYCSYHHAESLESIGPEEHSITPAIVFIALDWVYLTLPSPDNMSTLHLTCSKAKWQAD